MSDRINIRLFLASGHLSPEASLLYVSGKMRDDLSTLVDEHLAQCTFCRQAITGLMTSVSRESLPDSLASLNMDLRTRARELHPPQGISRRAPRGTRYAWMAAAAVVLVGLVFSFYFINIQPPIHKLSFSNRYEDVHRDRLRKHELKPPAFPKDEASELMEEQVFRLTPEQPIAEVPLAIVEDEDAASVETKPEVTDATSDVVSPAPALAGAERETGDDYDLVEEKVARQQEAVTLQEVVVQSDKGRLREKRLLNETAEIFTIVEEMPAFPGGTDGILQYLSKNLKIPADESLTPGKVIVGFIVDEKGRVREVEILRGMREDIDTEVLRIVKKMPNWTPGKQRNQPVRTRMSLPVLISPQQE